MKKIKKKKKKITFIEQFLWLLYGIGEEVFDIAYISRVRTWQDIANPERQKFWRELEKKKQKRQFAQFINYLKKKEYIKSNKEGVLLTPKGVGKCLRIKYQMGVDFKKRKDKKWIMVVFDIPEKLRKYRDEFRKYLVSFGFQKFQKSIWVCPYDVLQDVKEVLSIYSIERFVKVFIVKEVDVR